MNENKVHYMPSETVWAKETLRFSHPDDQNSPVSVLKSRPILPPPLYSCSNANSVTRFVAPYSNSKSEVVSFNHAQSVPRDVSKPQINAGGIHEQYVLQSDFANTGALQMCNAQQAEGAYYYPGHNKTVSSQFNMESNLPNTKQSVSLTPNVSQHEFRTGNQFSPANLNAFKNITSCNPNFPIVAPQSSHISNGFSSSEAQPVVNYINSIVSCPQSSSEKVPSGNSEIPKNNYNWPQPFPGVPPIIMPPQRSIQNPSFHVSCSSTIRCVNPQAQASTCVAPYNPIDSHFSVLPNNITKSSDIGPSTQYRYPPPVISKVNSDHNTFSSDVFPTQQPLLHPNVSFPPPPAFPHGIYPAPPMPVNFPVISNLCNIVEVPKFKSERKECF